MKFLFMFALAAGFWTLIFMGAYSLLDHLKTNTAEIPAAFNYLSYKILSMVLLTFMSILLFSNVITGLSTFFLSDDLELLLSAPVDLEHVRTAKYAQCAIISSWMVLLFAAPIFVAFGMAFNAGIGFYVSIPVVMVPFILIPASLGSMLIMALVKAFPARKARDVLLIASILFIAVLYTMLRMLKPEQLMHPEGFNSMVEYFSSMRIPANEYMPSEWATRVLMGNLTGLSSGNFELLTLWVTAIAGFIIFGWMSNMIYPEALSRVQEARRARISASKAVTFIIKILAKPFGRVAGAIVSKDMKTFLRDTTQWSQLILLAALVVVYIFNFRALPLDKLPVDQFKLKNVVSFVNMGLAGFVVAAVAVRFVFPAVSLEGRSFWVILTSPLSAGEYLKSKFYTSALPLVIIAESLILLTNHLLKVSPIVMALTGCTLLLMAISLTGLGVGMGAIYPKFHFENPAQIAAGFGGVLYMVIAMSIIAVVVALEAGPTYILFMAEMRGVPLDFKQKMWITISLGMVVLLLAVTTYLPMRIAIKKIDRMETGE